LYKKLDITVYLLPGFFLSWCSQSGKDSSSFNANNVPAIELSGTGYETGLKHGQLLKNEIAEVFTK
jgi:hypothetical protein